MTMRVSWVCVKDSGCCSRKWICMKGRKGERAQTHHSQLFLCLGRGFLDPLCSRSISGTTHYIIYYIIIIIERELYDSGVCALAGFAIRYSYDEYMIYGVDNRGSKTKAIVAF